MTDQQNSNATAQTDKKHDMSLLERVGHLEHKIERVAKLFEDGFQLSDLLEAAKIVRGFTHDVTRLKETVFPQEHRG